MRKMLLIVLGSMVIAPVAWAGRGKKVDAMPGVSAEAKMIAADRSGQKEYPKLTGKNDLTDEFNVSGRIDFKDKDGNVVQSCPYTITLYAKKTTNFDLPHCTYPVATSIDLLVDKVEQAQPLEPAPF